MPVSTSYLVCATPRSGSSLLCEVLTGSGLAGHPEEYFWKTFEPEWSRRWGTSDYGHYLQSALEETCTANGVFGAKIMRAHLDYFVQRLRTAMEERNGSAPLLLSRAFPNLHYIWIRRHDTVRQAVSLWRAAQTRVWNETAEGRQSGASEQVHFDFAAIDGLVQGIESHNASWKHLFTTHDIMPLVVFYEDLALDPEGTARRVLQYLSVTAPDSLVFGPRRLRKQADALSEEWVHRYRALRSTGDPAHSSPSRGAASLALDVFSMR